MTVQFLVCEAALIWFMNENIQTKCPTYDAHSPGFSPLLLPLAGLSVEIVLSSEMPASARSQRAGKFLELFHFYKDAYS